MNRVVFILGCERSGSTWLSNIIDSHPRIELYMEPFADYANIFPGFPERNIYLSDENIDLINLLSNNFQKLYKLKNPLFYKPGKFLFYKSLDNLIVNSYEFIGKILHYKRSDIISQYRLLNLNQSGIPASQQFKKDINISTLAIKELRLNFKIKVLSKIFPNAKYIIIIRNPGAQISSILKLFKKNNLGELKKSLLSFFEIVTNCTRFEKYYKIINENKLAYDMEINLIIWWIINYEVLIEDALKSNIDFKIVYHEIMSEDVNRIGLEIFKFCGLNFDEQVKTYIRMSSKRDRTIISPIDTVRDSSSYYKKMIESVDKNLHRKIESIFSNHNCIETLRCYHEELQQSHT